MIEKQSFYHGVALVRLLESNKCQKICRHDFGYSINDSVYLFIKYSTKSRSPWAFSFSEDEIRRLNAYGTSFKRIAVALICGGDGICALLWTDTKKLLGDKAGRISVKRQHNKQYAVEGSEEALPHKIPLKQWPLVVFESNDG